MNALAEQIKQSDRITNLNIPGFKGSLKEFQKKGVLWLYAMKRSLLADQCGLGKTIELLAWLCILIRMKQQARRALIAVPSASTGQWHDEIIRFTDLRIGPAYGQPILITFHRNYTRS